MGRSIWGDSDDAWVEDGNLRAWCKHPRLLCIDGNMGLFRVPEQLALAGVKATLLGHHAEFPRVAKGGGLQFLPGASAEHAQLLVDSMGIFVLGRHDGCRSQGDPRKALQGVCIVS